MKKYLVFTIALFLFCNVRAVTEKYSEWSSEYPKDINALLIRKEYRYLWYKDVITDEEFIMKELVKDKIIDYNDIVYKESEESIIRPEAFISRVIHIENKNYTFKKNDIDSISIKFNDTNVYELEIYISDEKYNYDINEEYKFLNDNDYNVYKNINENIDIKLDNKYDIDDIVIKLYYDNNSSVYIAFKSYIYDVFYNEFNLDNNILVVDSSSLKSKLVQNIPIYKYRDKLYRTYKMTREYTKEYYSEYDSDYTKDESSKKEFYSYLLNDYVIVDSKGNIVKNMDYCIKNFCSIEIIEEKEEENPKTGDFIGYSFILLFISFVIISVMLYIFYKKIVTKKSSFVESL